MDEEQALEAVAYQKYGGGFQLNPVCEGQQYAIALVASCPDDLRRVALEMFLDRV